MSYKNSGGGKIDDRKNLSSHSFRWFGLVLVWNQDASISERDPKPCFAKDGRRARKVYGDDKEDKWFGFKIGSYRVFTSQHSKEPKGTKHLWLNQFLTPKYCNRYLIK